MGLRKVFAHVFTSGIAALLAITVASPAVAADSNYTQITATVTVPSGGQFVVNNRSPAFNMDLAVPGTFVFDSPNSPKFTVRFGTSLWSVNTTDFGQCFAGGGSFLAPLQLSDCGLIVKVNGNAVGSASPASDVGVMRSPGTDGLLTLVFNNSVVPVLLNQAATKTITIEVAEGVFNVGANSSKQFEISPGEMVASGAAQRNPLNPQLEVYSPGTITFDSVQGSGTMPNSTETGSHALPLNTFTRSGYTFAGWADSLVKARSGVVDYQDGAIFSYTNATLYAVWTADESGANNASSANGATLARTGAEHYWILTSFAVAILAVGGAMLLARRINER